MQKWLYYSILSLLFWGLWGFFSKLATNYISPVSVLFYGVLGAAVSGITGLLVMGFRPEGQPLGISYALISSIVGTAGAFFYYFALSRYKASVVITLTALYPMVTIVLSFIILKEGITLKQGIGILFALLAVVFFSL